MGKLQGFSPFFVAGAPAKTGVTHPPIDRFLLKEIRGKSVFDLGGGEGAYSSELKKVGFKTMVADIDAASLSVAEKNGLQTRLLTLNESLGENIADTVIVIEVLEHVPNPILFLQSAIHAAKQRVLFTLPCIDDFETLFETGLTYAHIAVEDHLWHYSYKEMKEMLDSLGVDYTLRMDDYLCPGAAIKLLRHCFRGPFGFLLMLPLRIMNKLGLIPKRYPSRFYGIIEKTS